jgi:hypothetical protein
MVLVVGLTGALLAGLPGTSHAGGPGKWTKLSTIDNAFATFGMLRTSDGHLHLVWLNKQASDLTNTYGTATLSLAGSVLGTGTAFPHWDALDPDPQLVKDGSQIRLVFIGATGPSGCFSTGLVYTGTSSTGLTFTLATNTSMSSHSAGIDNLAATAASNGTTPIAAFAAGRLFHENVDTCPAGSSDGTITMTSGSAPTNPSIATDTNNGSVWVAWYQNFQKPGYWVDKILPIQSAPVEAPGSDDSSPKQSNHPLQPVALAARAGGGEYMAYCAATSSKACAHIDLWKVGASTAMQVPDSATGNARHVALAAGKQGRLTVLWYDTVQNKIHAVRTNTAATAFGTDRTISPPPNTSTIESVQGEGTFGRLDVLVNDQLSTAGFPVTLWQTQILAGLSLTASPAKFSNTAAHTVTFAVKDAKQAVQGAKVSCKGLTKTDTTDSAGKATLTFPKNFPTGSHVCTAGASNYNPGKVTLTVTH